jgi:hypothetical protein
VSFFGTGPHTMECVIETKASTIVQFIRRAELRLARRLTLARKIAAITLIVWKKEVRFRRQLSETASSLSASGEESRSIPGSHFLAVAIGFLRRSISRGSSNRKNQARASGTRVSGPTPCPLGQSKKAIRPRVSYRTMHCH